MAKSRYEYVKLFEKDDTLLLNTWIIVRIDGRGFHGFCRAHGFEKPNDVNALNLMNTAAKAVMKEFSTDIVFAYGDSDEYSFLLSRQCKLYGRREFKIITAIVSMFTSYYVFHWKDHFPGKQLKYPPSFDGRAVLYPDAKNVRDYFAWRQADCHINNLHNTTFWALVNQGMSEQDATRRLEGTEASDKNEILWTEFGKNYNKEPMMFRKGTVLFREAEHAHHEQDPELSEQISESVDNVDTTPPRGSEAVADSQTSVSFSSKPSVPVYTSKSRSLKGKKHSKKYVLKEEYIDIIKDTFWELKPWILT